MALLSSFLCFCSFLSPYCLGAALQRSEHWNVEALIASEFQHYSNAKRSPSANKTERERNMRINCDLVKIQWSPLDKFGVNAMLSIWFSIYFCAKLQNNCEGSFFDHSLCFQKLSSCYIVAVSSADRQHLRTWGRALNFWNSYEPFGIAGLLLDTTWFTRDQY